MLDSFFSMFRKRSAKTLAQVELEDTRRYLLGYQSQKEYYESMVTCTQARIERLKKYVMSEEE